MSNEKNSNDDGPASSFQEEIAKFARSKLKPTQTKISYADGRQFVKNSADEQEKEIVDKKESKLVVMNDDQTSSTYWTQFSGFVVDVTTDLSIDEIVPNLYLSGDDVAVNRQLIDSHRITRIVNLTTNVPNKFEDQDIIYKRIVIYDLPTEQLTQHFKDTFSFIDEAVSLGKSVLVHCNAGKATG